MTLLLSKLHSRNREQKAAVELFFGTAEEQFGRKLKKECDQAKTIQIERLDSIYRYRQNSLKHLIADSFLNQEAADSAIDLLPADWHHGISPIYFENNRGEASVIKRGNRYQYEFINDYLLSPQGSRVRVSTEFSHLGKPYVIRDFIEADKFVNCRAQRANSLGRFLAFSFIFSLFDIHNENAIYSKDVLVPFDVDCLFYPIPSCDKFFNPNSFWFSDNDGWLYKNSILSPRKDIATLTDISIRRGAVSIEEIRSYDSHAFDDEKMVLSDYYNEVVNGIREQVFLIGNNIKSILSFMDDLKTHTYRGIYMPTRLYSLIISETFLVFPQYINNLINLRLDKIRPTRSMSEVKSKEISSLKNADVPIFYFSERPCAGGRMQHKLANLISCENKMIRALERIKHEWSRGRGQSSHRNIFFNRRGQSQLTNIREITWPQPPPISTRPLSY